MNAKQIRSIGVVLSAAAIALFSFVETDAGLAGRGGGGRGGGGNANRGKPAQGNLGGMRGGGGGGGGGNRGGGGGNMNRGGGGGASNVNRGGGIINRGGGGGGGNAIARQGGGGGGGANRPGGGANRQGGMGSLGTRPINNGPKNQMASRPANRPDLGINKPGGNDRPGGRPGGNDRSPIRPGGNAGGNNRPGGNNRLAGNNGNRKPLPDFSQRPTSRPAERPGLNNKIADNRGDRIRPGADGGGIQKQRPGTRPGQDGGGIQRPGIRPPDGDRPGKGGEGTKRPIADLPGLRPDGTRPGQDGGGIQKQLPRFPNRPGQGGSGTQRPFPDRNNNNRPNRPIDNGGVNLGNKTNIGNTNTNINNRVGNNRIGDNINNQVNYNHWENNHQTVINNSPTINNYGYRPGAAWRGNGYGYRGDWGYGGGAHFHDNSWCYGPGWRPAYSGYHGGWYHGACSNSSNWTSFAAGAVTGVAAGWTLGSRAYDWGYTSYANPYYTPAVQTQFIQQSPTVVYNYSQPINTEVPPPEESVAAPAVSTFDQARTSFENGDYEQALKLTDQAIAKMPNDATMHEFRALILFAQGKYDESAAVLYSVLSVGPGWDWTTLAGLYANIDVYTSQLRNLENYQRQHPDQAAPAFLLAYQYLTQGHDEAAADMYATVLKLQPNDTLSQGLLAALRPSPEGQEIAKAPEPQNAENPESPETQPSIDPARIQGEWKAPADQKTTIALALQPDEKFTWDVIRDGKPHRIEGTYTIDGDQLSLAQAEGGAMVGTVQLQPAGGFIFRAIGSPPEDKGLAFAKG